MRRILGSAAAVIAFASLLGCPEKPTLTIDSGAAELVEAPVDAGPLPPTPLAVQFSFDLPDAGPQEVTLELGQKTLRVPQAANIELATNQPIRNYRVRLFDEADKVIPSNDSADDQADGLHYVIGLEAPLKTGYRYALVFDAQNGAAMLDAQGRPISDLRYEFVVAGERQKPPPPPPKKKSGSKRRK